MTYACDNDSCPSYGKGKRWRLQVGAPAECPACGWFMTAEPEDGE